MENLKILGNLEGIIDTEVVDQLPDELKTIDGTKRCRGGGKETIITNTKDMRLARPINDRIMKELYIEKEDYVSN